MTVFLAALGNKYFLWALIVIGIMGTFQLRSCQQEENERLATYSRQLKGQLSDKERELQKANLDLGVAQSELLSQKDLAKRLKKDKEEVDNKFDEFVKDHDLVIKSKDKTIARLRRKLLGGTTEVGFVGTCTELKDLTGKKSCAITYSWEDSLSRFKLDDPDIFTKGNEVFESNQIFKVYGEVWEQKDSSLQIRRLVLREVHLGENGEFVPTPNGKAEIIDSKFEYHNPPADPALETDWRDLFRLRAIGIGSVALLPGTGMTKLGIGAEFFNWNGWGLNLHTALDFDNLEKLHLGVGTSYSPRPFGTDLNLAIGLSASTTVHGKDSFRELCLNLDLIFYINQ